MDINKKAKGKINLKERIERIRNKVSVCVCERERERKRERKRERWREIERE